MKTIKVNIDERHYEEMRRNGINPKELFEYAASYILSNPKGTNWYYSNRSSFLREKIEKTEQQIFNIKVNLKSRELQLSNYKNQLKVLEENFVRDRISTRLCNLIEILNERIVGLNYDSELIIKTHYELIEQIIELDSSFDLKFHINLIKNLQ